MVIGTRQMIDDIVGSQLQSLRVYARLHLDEAARRLNLDPVELSAYEAGEARPIPRTVLAMADAYGVAPSRIFEILTRSEHA